MTAQSSEPLESITTYAERMSMRLALPIGILFTLIVLIANHDRNMVPMLGDHRSFATLGLYMLAPTTLIVSAIAYVMGVNAWNARVTAERQRKWYWAVLPVSLAFTLMLFFLTAAGMHFIEMAFQGLELMKIQGALVSGAVGAVIIYWVVGSAIQIKTRGLLQLLVIVLAGGVYITMTTVDDPLWWQVSFSYLGTMDSSSELLFNATLVFGGILILIWLPYFMSDFHILVEHDAASERGAFWLRFGLIVLAVGVALVGVFPSRASPLSSLIHNLSAYSLAAAFGLLMFGTKWMAPSFSRETITASWIIVAGLTFTLIMAAFGRVNTVGLEIIAFVLGMTWLSLFVNSTESLAVEMEPEAFPH